MNNKEQITILGHHGAQVNNDSPPKSHSLVSRSGNATVHDRKRTFISALMLEEVQVTECVFSMHQMLGLILCT